MSAVTTISRATSIAQALSADEARHVAAAFIRSVERLDTSRDADEYVRDVRAALSMALDYAGVDEQWISITEKAA